MSFKFSVFKRNIIVSHSFCLRLDEVPYLRSHRATVEVVYGHSRQVNIFKTANIDGGHRIAFWIDAFSIGKDATDWAEAMLDKVFIESVGASCIFGAKQAKIGAWHKPQK